MDRDFFLNAGIHFEPSSQMPPWKLMSPAPEMSYPPENSPVDRFHHFESALSSMVSSPVSNSVSPNDAYPGKLGSICNGAGEISLSGVAPVVNTSCYTTPLNSPPPPKLNFLAKENMLSHGLPLLPADPGFAERAAKFSCFGSRSFNGRSNQFGLNTNNHVSPLAKLPRVSSSPSLKIHGSAMAVQEKKNSLGANSNEESSVSEHIEIVLNNMNDSNSRKRKKAKEEPYDDSDSKKKKKTDQEGKTMEDNNGETEKNTKPPEPPKDYIHVRARRGQATDSHSLAERVRREKISERMKLLQDLVPGCNKVTGKALMLDEIINYVQSLQHQVEFLSMKLATVNPKQDFDINGQLSKDMNQSNQSSSHQLYPIETSASDFYQQNAQFFNGSAPVTHSPVDPSPPVHGFTEAFSQFAGFGGDDLHSIVEMGFGENRNRTSEMKIEL